MKKKKSIRKKQAVVFVTALFISTLFATTVYAQCPCQQQSQEQSTETSTQAESQLQVESYDGDIDAVEQYGNKFIDENYLCGIISTGIAWLQQNRPDLYDMYYGQYIQGSGGEQQGGSNGDQQQNAPRVANQVPLQSEINHILMWTFLSGQLAVFGDVFFTSGDDNDSHPLNITATLYEMYQDCKYGNLGLIGAILSQDIVTCLLSCLRDVLGGSAALCGAIGLFLTGVGWPLALILCGIAGAEYGLAITCYNICMLKFGG